MDGPDSTDRSDRPGRADDRPLPDDLHWVLTDRRRRLALAHLRDRGSATLTELTDAVARSTDRNPERVRVSLDRHHLPAMAEAGLLNRDPSSGAVALADLSPRTRERLDRQLDGLGLDDE
ncbi:DUF7344 domain-containing protein [Halorussus sp. AFM4]|uniref:DUF7344 domain-containing protein n=1 Tax=Halorussus sp. AFM4 TaxID=3421651 RepID=UPI003EBC0B86